MKKPDIERRLENPFLIIVPEASNHFIVKTRNGNYVELYSDMSKEDNIVIFTKGGGRIVIDNNGGVSHTL